jgi:tetratricopeptide (TPR) repeat protein
MKQSMMDRVVWKTFVALALSLLVQQGCQNRKSRSVAMPAAQSSPMDFLKQGPISFPSFFSLPKVKTFIQQGQLKEASLYVNQSINIEPRNAALHLLNAFIYESLLDTGQDDCKELIEIAYRTAMDLDPSLWLTHYLRGLNALKMSKYKEAQKYFVEAYSLCSVNPDVTYSLAYASYYAYDLPVALTFIEKAAKMCPKKPEIIRSAAMICAAAGEKVKAEQYLNAYSQLVGKNQSDIAVMKQRLNQWAKTGTRIQLMGSAPSTEAAGLRANTEFSSFETKKGNDEKNLETKASTDSPPSLIFDTTLISYSDQKTESRGQNIFNSLQVVLGGTGDNSGGLDASPQWNIAKKFATSSVTGSKDFSSTVSTLAYGITPFAMQYSLNIANSGRSKVELVSRASLSTTLGHSAYFLQGAQYTGSTAGNLTGAATASIDAGMKIEIRPVSLSEQGEVVLEITLVGSDFVNLPNSGIGISNQLIQIQRSKVSTTVKAMLGQTIVISGIQTQQRNESRSGFPLLQSIPLVQYFTSSFQKNDDITSAIFLMTPRLGGNSPLSAAQTQQQRSIAQQLQKRGIMSQLEYSNIYHILRTIQSFQLMAFSQLRSGDLPSPVRAYDQKNCREKISQLASFLWY